MDGNTPLYPLRFEPIFTANIWGGHRLRPMLRQDSPAEADPVGEAWILSDQGERLSRVADGPLAGVSLRELIARYGDRLLGPARRPGGRFPLLLKLLEARQPLSVQVHPNDDQASLMTGEADAQGKTEAWVILEAEADSQIYAGLRDGITAQKLRRALEDHTAANLLHTFQPAAGDCVFLRSGTVHALGAGLMLFEIQQTSDITYRLYDWGRVDAKTGRPRELHVAQSLACADFGRGPCGPVRPLVLRDGEVRRERLVDCEYFELNRWESDRPFVVGEAGRCRVLVCVGGTGTIAHAGAEFSMAFGDVVMLPAEIGAVELRPAGDVCVLECGLPCAAGSGLSGESIARKSRRAG